MASLVTVGLFGTQTRTATLVAVHALGETHAAELARIIGRSLSRVQASLDSLERAGVLVGALEGGARRVRLSPRYPAKPELEALLDRLVSLDTQLLDRLAAERRRPRRASKSL